MNDSTNKKPLSVRLELECPQCQMPATIRIHLETTSFDWTCPNGHYNPSFFGTDITIGYLLLERSRHELAVERDYCMSIVIAAMAFECEMSRLFGKWKQIEAGIAGCPFDREKCEEELRKLGAIDQKIEGVSKFLVGKGTDDFISGCPDLTDSISKDFTSIKLGSVARDFQQSLFWPRNQVLHWGDTRCSQEDAARCYRIAQLGLSILKRMAAERRQSLPR